MWSNIQQSNIGQQAEKRAVRYLKNKGLTLIESNYHCRFGEIDIIMQDNETLVFVEVRSRRHNAMVSAIESINHAKISKLRKTAHHYVMRFNEMPNCRFDVIAMTHSSDKKEYTINWIKGAF